MNRASLWLTITMAGATACGPSVVFDDGEGGSSSTTDPGPAGAGGSGPTGSSGSGAAGVTGSGVGGSATSGSGSGGWSTSATGAGGAATTSSGSGSSSGGAPSTGSVGAGGEEPCKTCSGALNGAPGPLCPWSQPLFAAVVQCGCVDHCPADCAQACNGGSGDPNCGECLYQHCYAELDACWQD